ncbi:MAG: hypothetical protein ACHQET_05830 [Chitinophagales bacterium]
MKKSITFLAFSCWASIAGAQACKNSPAECPEQYYLTEDHIDDSLRRLGNPVVPQEVGMEYRLRSLTRDLVSSLAEKEGWPEPILISEGGASGFRNVDEGVLAYPLRPPHQYEIVWELVVNKDSLDAWTAWLQNFSEQQMADLKEYAGKASDPSGAYMANYDSAKYYGDQESNYMAAHMAAYQQALLKNDKSEIQRYERAIAAYDKKINAFGNKAGESVSGEKYVNKDNSSEDLRKRMTLQYRDACVLHIQFDFNDYLPEISAMEGDQLMPISRTTAPPGQAVFCQCYKNLNASMQFNGVTFMFSRNINWFLFGNHYKSPKGLWRASYEKDKNNIDKVTVKKIKSDQIQVISIVCSGNRKAIDRTVDDMNWTTLTKQLVKE